MREALSQWDYVIAAYAVALLALGWLVVWSWRSMTKAEKRRDAAKREGRARARQAR
ncbi:MAG: hypothetical protein WA936_11720 [Erythrobacter sp.]